jgi:hypothetical protein
MAPHHREVGIAQNMLDANRNLSFYWVSVRFVWGGSGK